MVATLITAQSPSFDLTSFAVGDVLDPSAVTAVNCGLGNTSYTVLSSGHSRGVPFTGFSAPVG